MSGSNKQRPHSPKFISNGQGFNVPFRRSRSDQDELLKRLTRLDWEKTRTIFSLVASRLEQAVSSTENALCRLQNDSRCPNRQRKQHASAELRKFKSHVIGNMRHIDWAIKVVENRRHRNQSEFEHALEKIDILYSHLKQLHENSGAQIELARECILRSEFLMQSLYRHHSCSKKDRTV
ncbi:hypothetical protein ACOME3_001245 [Neoechinorhynchus agilis]